MQITPENLARTIVLASYGIVKPRNNAELTAIQRSAIQRLANNPAFKREVEQLTKRFKRLPENLLRIFGKRIFIITESKNQGKYKIVFKDSVGFEEKIKLIENDEGKDIYYFEFGFDDTNTTKLDKTQENKEQSKSVNIKEYFYSMDELLDSFNNYVLLFNKIYPYLESYDFDKLLNGFLKDKDDIGETDREKFKESLKNLHIIDRIEENRVFFKVNKKDEKDKENEAQEDEEDGYWGKKSKFIDDDTGKEISIDSMSNEEIRKKFLFR